MNESDSPEVVRSSDQLGLLLEPAAWANSSDLISARLGRERYGAHGACEMHTWREGGPTDYHGAPLYTAEQLRAAVSAERERWLLAVSWALGTNGDFAAPNTIGPYWWRSELAERCGIFWNGERWVDRPNVRA